MAAAFLEDETEDMVTCSICLYEYDEKLRLPKYLPKCHHTVCVSCLKVFIENYGRNSCHLSKQCNVNWYF